MEKAAYDYLIIGGGIAGVTAAETVRSHDSQKKIAILSAEPHPLYSRVLLPAYLKNKIPRERMFLRAREDFTKKGVDLYSDTEAMRVDAARRIVETKDGRTFGFEHLLIASGGAPHQWPHAPEDRRMYRLQTIDDADRLRKDMDSLHSVLVIGSSFIALEFIEIFLQNGIAPKVLVRDSRFFGAFLDTAGGNIMEATMNRHGVECMFEDEVRDVAVEDSGYEIVSGKGRRISADALALGIGLSRNLSFLEGSGIALGKRGVKVNEYLETETSGIWAAGDIAEYFDPAAGVFHTAGNWTHAVLQGTRAGLNMAGDRAPFTSVPSYGISCLGMHMAAIGAPGGSEAITRADLLNDRYGRFFFQDGIIVGAFLINRAKDRPYFADLIARRAHLETFEQDSIWRV